MGVGWGVGGVVRRGRKGRGERGAVAFIHFFFFTPGFVLRCSLCFLRVGVLELSHYYYYCYYYCHVAHVQGCRAILSLGQIRSGFCFLHQMPFKFSAIFSDFKQRRERRQTTKQFFFFFFLANTITRA